MKHTHNYLCDSCFPPDKYKEVGELLTGFYLIQKIQTNEYFIFDFCHIDKEINKDNPYIFYWFSIAPEPEIADEDSKADEQFERVSPHLYHIKVPPLRGYELIDAAKKVGYDPDLDGSIEWWLFYKAGDLIKSQNY